MSGSPELAEREFLVSEIRTHGSGNASLSLVRGSNGSSPRKRHGTSWHVPIRTRPKSRNHCAGVLVAGFEHEDDARRFLDSMRVRFEEFALSLHPDKTRLIEFGRHAAVRRQRCGLGKGEDRAGRDPFADERDEFGDGGRP